MGVEHSLSHHTPLSQDAEKHNFSILEHGDIRINDEISEVTVLGEYVELTRTEYRLLHYLINRANHPVTKDDLLQGVWGYESADSPNLVELAIRRLRKKIEDNASRPTRLVTVRGFGYKLTDNSEKRRQPHPETTLDTTDRFVASDLHRNMNTVVPMPVENPVIQPVMPVEQPAYQTEQTVRTTY